MAKYVKVEDVVDFINGLDSLPFEEETADMVNRLDIYDTDKVIEQIAGMFGVDPVYFGEDAQWAVMRAIEIVKAGGVDAYY